MADRWSKRGRCEMCRDKGERYAYDGFLLCWKCKSTMTRSDNQRGGGGHPVQGCFSQGMRR